MAEALPDHEVSEAKELIYDGRPIITETDLHGRLTYVNRKFIEMSGYSKSELLGRSHNVVRHPDMPSSCYMLLWQTIRSGQSWQGYVKNRRKNGDYYWVVVHVSHKMAEGRHIGYIAVRKRPEPQTLEKVKRLYKHAKALERSGDFFEAEKLVTRAIRVNALGFPEEEMC